MEPAKYDAYKRAVFRKWRRPIRVYNVQCKPEAFNDLEEE